MNLNSKPLRISVISDVHVGSKRNETKYILENLYNCFSNDLHLSNLDIVFIAGDFFDDLLTYPSVDAGLIDMWISRFLKKCNKYNIVVRVLEGTPSHDRQQSVRFDVIANIHCNVSHSYVDIAYIKTLSVEYIEKFDINVLYVPDEWNHETSVTLTEVKELLQSKDIDKVDIAIMHGLFDYQMDGMIKDNIKHNSKEYLELVKGLIFIGHIHKHSSLDRIYAGGSFDRLAHGEEESKGYLDATLNPDYSYTVSFIENTNARKFLTINCPYEDVEINLKRIDKKVKLLNTGSYVRITSKQGNAITSSLDTVRKRWPLLNWSMLIKDKDEKEDTVNVIDESIYTPMIISKDTIIPLVTDRINKMNIDSNVLDRCMLHLKELT